MGCCFIAIGPFHSCYSTHSLIHARLQGSLSNFSLTPSPEEQACLTALLATVWAAYNAAGFCSLTQAVRPRFLRIGPSPGLGPCPQNQPEPPHTTAAARISSTPKQATAKTCCGWHTSITHAPMCGVLQDWQRVVGTGIGTVQAVSAPTRGCNAQLHPNDNSMSCRAENTTQPERDNDAACAKAAATAV